MGNGAWRAGARGRSCRLAGALGLERGLTTGGRAGEGRGDGPSRLPRSLQLGLLFLVVVACYAPSLGNG